MASGKAKGSQGGRGNEAGSLHRSGVAAYLAAYGLAGRAVVEAGYPSAGPAPVAVLFETGDAVDDIRCELADGTVLLIQAKRTVGADQHLRDTVSQWAAQAADLRPGDRVALATAQTKGDIKALGAALQRRRGKEPGRFPTPESKAIKALDEAFPSATSSQVKDSVMDVALVLEAAVSTRDDAHFTAAANLLEGLVVLAGRGVEAIEALQRAFQEQAVKGTGSAIDEWLTILAEAGIDVFADAEGPAGPRREAERRAVSAYRARLGEQADLLAYSLLADDLRPLKVPDLVKSFRVGPRGERPAFTRADDLVDLARRWERMLLTGLPGMGKSTALEQLAAAWSTDAEAPVPIFISLSRVARGLKRAADLTLAVLIEDAVSASPAVETASLRRGLEKEAQRGNAVLLLDGLDETREQRGIVTDGLRLIFDQLPDGAGVIISTRASALPAAAKLDLPEAELLEPSNLTGTLHLLLQHYADCHVPSEQRQQWIDERTTWLDSAHDMGSGIWQVPLLATLLTLLAARRGMDSLPTDRAHVLVQAVQDSVERWEKARPGLSDGSWNPRLTTGILIDTYREIGHLLNESGSESLTDVRRNVVELLASPRWQRSPGDSAELAGEALRFWDDQMGVFVLREGEQIMPRSRVFAEIGDAMWIAERDARTRAAWAATAVRGEERRETVILAAGLSPDIVSTLIDVATDAASDAEAADRALLWAAEAIAAGHVTDDQHLTAAIHVLAEAARRPRQEGDTERRRGYSAAFRRDNACWRFTRSLASLRLAPHLRAIRDTELASLPIEADQATIARALAALSDAATDAARQLSAEAVDSVNAMLKLTDAVAETGLIATGNGGVRLRDPGPWVGHIDAAERAIPYIDQCVDDAAMRVERLARRGSGGRYGRIATILANKGFDVRDRLRPFEAAIVVLNAVDYLTQLLEHLFGAAAGVAAPRTLIEPERWRLSEVCRLCDAIDLSQAPYDDLPRLVQTQLDFLTRWVRAVAHAAGLDLHGLAAQAAYACSQDTGDKKRFAHIVFAPPPVEAQVDVSRLTGEDIALLISALGQPSSVVADTAVRLLQQTGDHAVGARVEQLLPSLPAERRGDAAVLACVLNQDPLAKVERFLDQGDSTYRVAAAHALHTLPPTEERTRLLDRVLTDDDMSVRIVAGAPEEVGEQAQHWSCLECARNNAMSARECAHCGNGGRPRPIEATKQ